MTASPTTTTTTDPLTLAYIAMGAAAALTVPQGSPGRLVDRAEVEFMETLIRHAPMMDRLAAGREFGGMFYYEVAEPFGEMLAERMIADGDLSDAEAEALATELIAGAVA
ncbi:hypothetical protein [Rhodanobacter denitrificans]|uniref:hypothetical protein n=1 Tax=Rhodanobacter denitrificans TaxID=666685 RepID=UPI001F46F358|nr:hypothetical protein [Rhodanobacter denitrificans]UJJ60609.1 hypothetical protein LRK55_19435 [Rhodanobacter denitrificans]